MLSQDNYISDGKEKVFDEELNTPSKSGKFIFEPRNLIEEYLMKRMDKKIGEFVDLMI